MLMDTMHGLYIIKSSLVVDNEVLATTSSYKLQFETTKVQSLGTIVNKQTTVYCA